MRHSNKTTSYLFYLLTATLITPLIFFPSLYSPFQGAKVLFFLVMMALTLPLLVGKMHAIKTIIKHPVMIALLLFVAWMILSSAIGADPWNSFFGNVERATSVWLTINMTLFALLSIIVIQSKPEIKDQLIKMVIGMATLTAVYGIFEALSIFPTMAQEFFPRASSIFGNPIFFASFLMLPLFFSLDRLRDSGRKALIYPVLIGLGILTAGTRGAFVALGGATVVWIVTRILLTSGNRKKIILSGATVLIILSGMFFAARALSPPDSLAYRATHFDDKNVSTRLINWGIGLNHWAENPILGVGHQNYYIVADKYFNPDIYALSDDWIDKPHNLFIEILVSEGLVGLALFLSLLLITARSILRSSQVSSTKALYLAGLTAYIVQSAFVFETISALLMFFFFLALVVSEHLAKSDKGSVGRIPIISATIISIALLLLIYLPTTNVLLALGATENTRADQYQEASDSSFIFDLPLIADKYGRLVVSDPTNNEVFSATVTAYELALTRHPLRAQYWYGLSHAYLVRASSQDEPVAQAGIDAAQRALELAPNRVEPLLTLAFAHQLADELDQAIELAEQAYAQAPEETSTLWTLSQIYLAQDRIDEAAKLGFEAIAHGIELVSVEPILWIINYYVQLEQYDIVLKLYQSTIKIDSADTSLLPGLAAAYAAVGQIDKAIEVAEQLKLLDPNSSQAVDLFIKSLLP